MGVLVATISDVIDVDEARAIVEVDTGGVDVAIGIVVVDVVAVGARYAGPPPVVGGVGGENWLRIVNQSFPAAATTA